jgi:putative transposase
VRRVTPMSKGGGLATAPSASDNRGPTYSGAALCEERRRGIDICHETVRFWWNRFGPMFAAAIRKRRVRHRLYSNWRWHLDEVFVRINGKTHYLWRAVDHEGEVLEVFATERRDRSAALKVLKRAMKRYGRPGTLVTDRLRSYGAAMKAIGIVGRHECGRWLNNRAENSHQPFRRREGAMAKFRDIRTLQKFAAVHASIQNHFHQDRHDIFKQKTLGRSRRMASAGGLRSLAPGVLDTNSH